MKNSGPSLGRWRDRIEVAVVINQLATPGLGSWLAGRRIAGAGQLVLSFAGFGLYLVFFGLLLRSLWAAATGDPPPPAPAPFWWKNALALFGIAWLWSGVTSIQLLLERRRRPPPPLPPRLPQENP